MFAGDSGAVDLYESWTTSRSDPTLGMGEAGDARAVLEVLGGAYAHVPWNPGPFGPPDLAMATGLMDGPVVSYDAPRVIGRGRGSSSSSSSSSRRKVERGAPRSLTLVTNSNCIVEPLLRIAGRAERMCAAGAFMHVVARSGHSRDDLLDAVEVARDVAAGYRDATSD